MHLKTKTEKLMLGKKLVVVVRYTISCTGNGKQCKRGVDITPPGLSCIELKHKCLVNKNEREKNKHGVLLFVYLNYEISREKNGNIAHCEVGAQLG